MAAKKKPVPKARSAQRRASSGSQISPRLKRAVAKVDELLAQIAVQEKTVRADRKKLDTSRTLADKPNATRAAQNAVRVARTAVKRSSTKLASLSDRLRDVKAVRRTLAAEERAKEVAAAKLAREETRKERLVVKREEDLAKAMARYEARWLKERERKETRTERLRQRKQKAREKSGELLRRRKLKAREKARAEAARTKTKAKTARTVAAGVSEKTPTVAVRRPVVRKKSTSTD